MVKVYVEIVSGLFVGNNVKKGRIISKIVIIFVNDKLRVGVFFVKVIVKG